MRILLTTLLFAGAVFADELKDLRTTHPRLLVTNNGVWAELRQRAVADRDLAQVLIATVSAAEDVLAEKPAEREQVGRRILSTSRKVLQRVSLLAAAYHLTGKETYAQRAKSEMIAAAEFTDWNPSHFLDVAEMTAGLAIGYDWLYETLSEAERAQLVAAIRDKGLRPALTDKNWNWWQRGHNNWNQVCFGGMVLGALAIADLEPETAATILEKARAGIGSGLKPYSPDGVYPEGPNYWHYGTYYSVIMIEALRSALGTDWQIPQSKGFLASSSAYVQLCGPSGITYNFSDGNPSASFRPALFWFAKEREKPGLLFGQRDLLPKRNDAGVSGATPMAALWWPENGIGTQPEEPLFWAGDGENPVAVFRESWTDPGAMYLGCKGGSPAVSHGHMDVGSFVLEADGVRWAVELKQQNYHNLESQGIRLWDQHQVAGRWKIFRLGPFSHSTLTINGELHRADAFAPLKANVKRENAVIDLSAAFGKQVQSARRGFARLPGRTVLIQDELTGLAPGAKVRWAMLTRAEVKIRGNQALLHQDGQELHAIVGDGLTFSVTPATPPDDGLSAPNPGVSILTVNASPDQSGALRIPVKLRPGKPVALGDLNPLADWQ